MYIYNLTANAGRPVDVLTRRLFVHETELPDHNGRLIRKAFICRGHDINLVRRIRMLIGLLLYFPYVILRNRYDIVVLNQEIVWNSLLIVWSKLLRVKSVGVAYAEEVTMSLKGKSLKSRIKKLLLKTFYKRADGFISVCSFTKNLLLRCGFSFDQVRVIPPMLLPGKSGQSEQGSFSGKRILSVGRLMKRKGFHHLIDAVDLLRHEIPGIHLSIVGDGPERENLVRQKEEKELSDTVKIVRNVTDEQLTSFYEDCDVVVLANVMMPDGDCEGCPTVLIEAGSFGKPVVAGKKGGTDAAVDDGVTGYLIHPENLEELSGALRRILTDPELASRLGRAGRRKANRDHDPRRSGKAFCRYLEAVCRKTEKRSIL